MVHQTNTARMAGEAAALPGDYDKARARPVHAPVTAGPPSCCWMEAAKSDCQAGSRQRARPLRQLCGSAVIAPMQLASARAKHAPDNSCRSKAVARPTLRQATPWSLTLVRPSLVMACTRWSTCAKASKPGAACAECARANSA